MSLLYASIKQNPCIKARSVVSEPHDLYMHKLGLWASRNDSVRGWTCKKMNTTYPTRQKTMDKWEHAITYNWFFRLSRASTCRRDHRVSWMQTPSTHRSDRRDHPELSSAGSVGRHWWARYPGCCGKHDWFRYPLSKLSVGRGAEFDAGFASFPYQPGIVDCSLPNKQTNTSGHRHYNSYPDSNVMSFNVQSDTMVNITRQKHGPKLSSQRN